jgi:hypothetical protein
MRFCRIVGSQVPGDNPPWHQAYQSGTEVGRDALPTFGQGLRMSSNLYTARLKGRQDIIDDERC